MTIRSLLVCSIIFLQSSAPPAVTPGPRLGHSIVYDADRQRIILLDGSSSGTDLATAGELWTWNGDRWERIDAPGPEPRDVGAVVFDMVRKRLVSYGGRARGQAKNDLWTWNSERWEYAADTAAGRRFHHAMAFDSARGRTVMYGGAVGGRWDTDTWEWDGTRWKRISVPGPGMRAAFRMVYDSKRQVVVLFGGVGPPRNDGQPQTYYNDTWTWDGSTWRKVSDGGPPPRRDPSMSYDSRAGVILLYGGASSDRLADMWQWNGMRWEEIRLSSPNPGHRYVSAMAYDARRDRTVLYGGYACQNARDACGVLGDTWEWTGTKWEHRY